MSDSTVSNTIHTVHVVHFEPATDDGGVGGIEWNTDRATIGGFLLSLASDLHDLGQPNRFSYYEVQLDFDPLADRDATTDYLDQRIVSLDEIPPRFSFVVGIDERADGIVTVTLGGGEVHVGTVRVDSEEGEDEADLAHRQAAVAWNALTRNAVFKVGEHEFTATECAEWWA